MDASTFYGQTTRKVRIHDTEGVLNIEESLNIAALPENGESDEDDTTLEPDEITSLQNDSVFMSTRSRFTNRRTQNEFEDLDDDEVRDPTYVVEDEMNNNAESHIPQRESNQESTSANETRWRKRDAAVVPSKFTGKSLIPPEGISLPIEYFKRFFDTSLVEHIADQTNLYCTQQKLQKNLKNPHIQTDQKEIEEFIGVLLYMGIYPNPQYRMYWGKHAPLLHITKALKGGVNRFEELRRFLHFNNSEDIPSRDSPNYDKLFKVRPIISSVLSKCNNLDDEEYHSVDEQIIPTKSRSSLKQYNPKKPNKWGYKVFTRCGSNGIVYDFEIYTGKSQNQASHLGVTGDLVIRLCRNLPEGCNYKVFFDNYFTSLPLLRELKLRGILAVGTIRQNRMSGAQKLLLSEKDLKKQGRGSLDWRVDASSNVTVIKWFDNSCVQLASSYIDHSNSGTVTRWAAKEERYIEIECPKIVREYNKFMGGVDLCDMLLSLYRIKLRSKKWYMPIFHYLIKLAVTNGWLLYRRDMSLLEPNAKTMPLLDFQCQIAYDLIYENKITSRRIGRPSLSELNPPKRSKTTASVAVPTGASRYDCIDHFAVFDEKQHRCRHCTEGKTRIKCMKCDIFLCLLKDRNCFLIFHKS